MFTVLFILAVDEVVPQAKMALVGRLVPAAVMLHEEMVLLSFPLPLPLVLKKMVPVPFPVEDPRIVQLVMVLLVASLMNLKVAAEVLVLVLEKLRELPPEFKPLMVTLSAPLRSNKTPFLVPETVLVPDGVIVRVVHMPAPPVSALVPASVAILAVMLMVIFLPAWLLALMAANAPPALVSDV